MSFRFKRFEYHIIKTIFRRGGSISSVARVIHHRRSSISKVFKNYMKQKDLRLERNNNIEARKLLSPGRRRNYYRGLEYGMKTYRARKLGLKEPKIPKKIKKEFEGSPTA